MLQIWVTCQRMLQLVEKCPHAEVSHWRVLCQQAVSMYSAIVDDPPDTGHRMQNGTLMNEYDLSGPESEED